MTKADEIVIDNFESKLNRLMEAHTQLKAENRQLRAKIDQQSVELDELRKQHTSLTQSYTDLKLAKIINMEDSDIENTRKRLSKLVREVDKCIALLNASEQKEEML
jgi:ribosomal protein L9